MEVEHVTSPGLEKRNRSKNDKKVKASRLHTNPGILIKKSTMIVQNFRDLEEEYEIKDKLGSGSYGIVKT
jgi:hypothetical protein